MMVAAHQPAYLPWLGYLAKIAAADLFVVMDDLQYEAQNFQNRNRIKTGTGPAWITVPVERGSLHFGYDAPVRIWLNGREVFAGHGTNPALVDQTSVNVKFRHGGNRIAVAMDTSSGTACGIFGRFDAEG